MPYRTTMTGSWFRAPEILDLLAKSPFGEIPPEHERVYLEAERQAIRDQLRPDGKGPGLDQVSLGEQRVAGYVSYLPGRFEGFSRTERAGMPLSPVLVAEFQESNPALAAQLAAAREAFSFPKLEAPLRYRGEAAARRTAQDASRLAREEGARSVFVTAPSPGVVTIFYPNNPEVYPDHLDYLRSLATELHKEYRAVLDTPEVVLQIDAPDLAMGRTMASDWELDFYDALHSHVDAINRAVAGLPRERVRVHYCFGNYVSSHQSDADFARLLPELVRVHASALVGELANPHHEGDLLVLERFARDHGWPKGLAFAGGVIDVKTPIVESPRTVRLRLDRLASAVGAENTWGGTDCGFETFARMNGVTRPVALAKLRALADGARATD
jgi:5-methyltetrahydropteroyltriglutamate--homocysteine methyltransferase